MNFFEELGESIRKEWSNHRDEPSSFSAIAERHLLGRPPARYVEVDELLESWFASDSFPRQASLRSAFGQPPVTAYSAPGFTIDVLFWLTSTTSIHEHAFSGAFHVLSGSSIESRYRFSTEKVLSPLIELGTLELEAVEHLAEGATRPIRGGRELIHSVFHLPQPTVSVVVRTWSQSNEGPQFNYNLGGLAFDPFHRPEKLTRQLQLLAVLMRTDRARALQLAFAAIATADPHAVYRLLDACYSRSAAFDNLLERVRPLHPELVDAFPRDVEQRDRGTRLSALRSALTNSEHRFLLAILLTVPDRQRALDLVERAYPGDPKSTLLRWLEELSAISIANVENHPLAGIQLDETAILIAGHLLDGCTDGQVLERLRAEFGPEEVSSQRVDLDALLNALRGSPIFFNLLGASREGAR